MLYLFSFIVTFYSVIMVDEFKNYILFEYEFLGLTLNYFSIGALKMMGLGV